MNEQGTSAWRQDRCGKITASRISDVMARPMKGRGESSTRRNYMAELVGERLTHKAQDNFQSWDMKRGTELEPYARNEYEIQRGIISNTGFMRHPKFDFAGASPDGLVDEDGIVQFKCPKLATHLDWIQGGIVPTEHRPQMQFEMAVTGRKWCDFASYHPDLPENLRLFVVRFHRDEVEIEKIEAEVSKFNGEIHEIISRLPNSQPPAEPLRESVKETIRKARNPESELEISNADSIA